jgi:multimeric flavodoxin WrbA
MNLLAIVAGRRGKSTDRLVERALAGAVSRDRTMKIEKINLFDYRIEFCKNCLACRDSRAPGPYARCAIRDDMDVLSEKLAAADRLLFGTPVHMGYAPGILTTFLERVCWTFAKPERRILTIAGCPLPRDSMQRRAAIIVSSGVVPPLFRRFCDEVTHYISGSIRDSLNAKTIGSFYAGALEKRGVEPYLDKAFALGAKLV